MTTTTSSVTIGTRSVPYQKPWDGTPFDLHPKCPYVAFDTETELIRDDGEVPRLALAAVSSGRRHALLRPDQVGDFVTRHADARLVTHNVAFDFWVVDEHLHKRDEERAREVWRDLCDRDRLHDTMLLDVLIRLAEGERGQGKDWLKARDLGEVAAEYTSLTLDKADPYRLRYGEILDRDWSDVEDGFFSYAVKDPIATLRAYLAMRDRAELLMREHGHDPGQDPAGRHQIRPDALKAFGPLTEAIQVKGAIALAQVSRNGIHLDQPRRENLEREHRSRLDSVIQTLRDDYPALIKLDREGAMVLNKKSQTPAVHENVLRDLLVEAVGRIRTESGTTLTIPKTPTGKVSTSAKLWAPHADKDRLIRAWVEREQAGKRCEFFAGLVGKDVVRPRYKVLLRTGRTSCTKPNVQQMPRDGGFRELFVPSPGHLLLALDYSYVELRTLAAVCEARYGVSKLADTIRAGVDPHCHTAAMLLEVDLAEFMAWKDDPARAAEFKRHRQNAKAVNFGVPGGLGAKSLVDYARDTFGVEMNLDQAQKMRARLIAEVYPELNDKTGYLADGGMAVLAGNLKARVDDCWRRLDWKGTRDSAVLWPVRKVVRGEAVKADGTPYNPSFVRDIWDGLNALNHNGDPRLVELLEGREAGDELHRILFREDVVTTTGRVRGDVRYTQAKNTPFQSLAADGAKLALWDLARAGYRVVAFVHDEVLVELPDRGGYVALAECEAVKGIACRAMARVCGNVPVEAEYALSRRWSKDAKRIVDGDMVLPWDDAG